MTMRRSQLTALLTAAVATVGFAAPLHAEETEAYTSRKLRAQVEQYAGQCQLDSAFPLLARLTTLAQNYRDNIGGSRARAAMAQDAQAQLVAAQNSYARAREDCAKKQQAAEANDAGADQTAEAQNGDADNSGTAPTDLDSPTSGAGGSGPVAGRYGPLSAGAPISGADAISASAGEPRVTSAASIAASKRFARLLGRWTSRKHGGVIETYLEADGTMTGVIVAANKPMRDHGYDAGMTILRNYRPKMMTNTWIMAASNGQTFSAKQPDRKPGEIFGTAQWSKGGSVIFIAKANPNQLNLPASLENRLSNYDAWVRP
jgi:hypothetical protein